MPSARDILVPGPRHLHLHMPGVPPGGLLGAGWADRLLDLHLLLLTDDLRSRSLHLRLSVEPAAVRRVLHARGGAFLLSWKLSRRARAPLARSAGVPDPEDGE